MPNKRVQRKRAKQQWIKEIQKMGVLKCTRERCYVVGKDGIGRYRSLWAYYLPLDPKTQSALEYLYGLGGLASGS